MLANRDYVTRSQDALGDTAGVDERPVRTIEVPQNTALICVHQLRMMSTDILALNVNITVATIADNDNSIAERVAIGEAFIQADQHPAMFIVPIRRLIDTDWNLRRFFDPGRRRVLPRHELAAVIVDLNISGFQLGRELLIPSFRLV